jgi:acyl-CoA thioesterase I
VSAFAPRQAPDIQAVLRQFAFVSTNIWLFKFRERQVQSYYNYKTPCSHRKMKRTTALRVTSCRGRSPVVVLRWYDTTSSIGFQLVFRRTRGACLAAALLMAATEGSFAQAPIRPSYAETCLAANQNLALGASLPRTTARLKAGDRIRIIAIGSSSTAGLWARSSAATYPEVMRRELADLRPNVRIEVITSGRLAETIAGTMARFERDVLAYLPELVVWQLGTNDVAWGARAGGIKDQVVKGVRTLKGSGADVILMDLQYAPMVLASSQHTIMQAIIAEVARQERVGLFPRFALMRRSIEAGLPSGALVSWDGLHNSSSGYECIGRALARAVHAGGR